MEDNLTNLTTKSASNICYHINNPNVSGHQLKIDNTDKEGNTGRKRKASGMSAPNQNKRKNKDKIMENEDAINNIKDSVQRELTKIGKLDYLLSRFRNDSDLSFDFQNLSTETTSTESYKMIMVQKTVMETMEEGMEIFKKEHKDKNIDYIEKQEKLKLKLQNLLTLLQTFGDDMHKRTNNLRVVYCHPKNAHDV